VSDRDLDGRPAPPVDGLAALRGRDGLIDLRRLKVLSVVLPVGFIVALEFICITTARGDRLSWPGYVALLTVPAVAVAGFAYMMFLFIDRAQRHVVRQNRQLAAANAVSAAVRGELGVPQIAQAALRSVVAVSGAAEASIDVVAGHDQPHSDGPAERRRWHVSAALGEPDVGTGSVVDVPLESSTATIGHLRLRLPTDVRRSDLLAARTLDSIGEQLGCAIQIAQLVDDLQRRKHEGHGFYDVLLRISNQNPLEDVLGAVVKHAQELLSCDEAMLCLTDEAFRSVNIRETCDGPRHHAGGGSACFSSTDGRCHHIHGRADACPSWALPEWGATLAVPVGGATGTQGQIWVARQADDPFGARDRAFLDALSGLAAIAITSAKMRESERHAAILAERERIAREMHDSLAQVLGVTHLQLRALDSRAAVRAAPRLAAELCQLADICEEAYRDVREAILGLRESSRADRGLLESLEVYVEKYTQQSGIETTLDSTLDRDPPISPSSEIQVIRVIQEALTNVRKHSGASSAVVRIAQSPTSITFLVEDDGHGFDPDVTLAGADGFGTTTMRERMRLLGGRLTVDSAPGQGTRIVAEVPLSAQIQPGFAEVAGDHI
jgi:two-component system nitrate/nitrite sensor histidine kinase NarX